MSDVRIDRLANALLLELHEPFQVHERFAIAQKYLTEAASLLVQQESIPPSEGDEAGSNPAEATIPQADGCSVAPWSNE